MAEFITEINQDEYQKVLDEPLAALDFYSDECPPCEALAPKYEAVSKLYGKDVKFFKIFRQKNRELAEKLGVKGSPTVIFFQNGERVGETLTGGIKRSELMKNLDEMVGEAKAREIKKQIQPEESECELMILGAGPAGLTAAIYAAQAKVDTLVVDIGLPGGQVSTTHLVSNYPGFDKPQNGFMIMHYMQQQAENAGARFKSAVEVSNVDFNKKSLLLDGYETVKAKRIIVATGSSPRPLGIPGEKEYKGSGISYCATCDGKYYDGKEVVVIGGGNSALEEALFLTKFVKKLTIVHQFADFQANKLAQQEVLKSDKIEAILEHEPRKFEKTEGGMKVTIEDLKTKELKEIETDGIFVFVGMKPNLENFGDVFELDDFGYIKTDAEQHSSIDGVFAAGDIASKRYRQITIATADGTIAAIAAGKEIEAENRK